MQAFLQLIGVPGHESSRIMTNKASCADALSRAAKRSSRYNQAR